MVESKATFVEPIRHFPVWAMALTAPSPGTIRTCDATSMQMPKARVAQPATKRTSAKGQFSPCNPAMACMKKSMAALKTKLMAICSSSTGRNWRRSRAICKTMKAMLRTKVSWPKVHGV